jgi:hypothetical protein
MIAVLGLLIIIMLSVVVVRIGAIALEITGLSAEIASFQAQSAFSGVGFTTVESEAIVTHPVRRKIVRVLILLGSAGVTTSIATLVLTFVGQSGVNVAVRGVTLLCGLIFIFLFARSRHIYHIMKIIIMQALKRWTTLRIYDYEQLFGLGEGYALSRVIIKGDSRLKDKKIGELARELHNILILAIYRVIAGEKKLIGAPGGDTMLEEGDELICYAKEEVIAKLLG